MGLVAKLKESRNMKGIAFVYVALLIVVLFGFVALAVDISFMYVTKGQLQNAADAAALAGAVRLDGTIFTNQSSARSEAKRLAAQNRAAGEPVTIASDGSNALSLPITEPGGNDITVGNWNGTDYSTDRTPINAVQVRARRTVPGATATAAQQGQVKTFFGKLFALLPIGGVGWPFMGAAAEAIAVHEPLPVLPIPVCLPRCEPTPEETVFTQSCRGKKYLLNPPDAEPDCGIAWANIISPCPAPTHPLCQPPTPQELRAYFQNPQFIDLCGKCIRTKQGISQNVLTDLREAFIRNKTQIPRSELGLDSGIAPPFIDGWRVLIPIIEANPDPPSAGGCGPAPPPAGPKACPGDQPLPYKVVRMAEVILTDVDTAPADDCGTCRNKGQKGVGITLLGSVPKSSNSTTIRCFTCVPPDPSFPPPGRTRLVR